MPLPLLPNVFELSYDPGRDMLSGGWAQPLPMAQLVACYDMALATAQAQRACRFWLLDMRQRNWHSAEFGRWFRADFAPRAVAALGGPLFIAYVVAGAQQPLIESASTEGLLRQAAAVNCFPFYFERAEDGLAWLRDQQDGEQATRRSMARLATR